MLDAFLLYLGVCARQLRVQGFNNAGSTRPCQCVSQHCPLVEVGRRAPCQPLGRPEQRDGYESGSELEESLGFQFDFALSRLGGVRRCRELWSDALQSLCEV